jgi:hypothetical protein
VNKRNNLISICPLPFSYLSRPYRCTKGAAFDISNPDKTRLLYGKVFFRYTGIHLLSDLSSSDHVVSDIPSKSFLSLAPGSVSAIFVQLREENQAFFL